MQTERITLRRWQETDAKALYKYASDPDVGSHAGWLAHKSVEESVGRQNRCSHLVGGNKDMVKIYRLTVQN